MRPLPPVTPPAKRRITLGNGGMPSKSVGIRSKNVSRPLLNPSPNKDGGLRFRCLGASGLSEIFDGFWAFGSLGTLGTFGGPGDLRLIFGISSSGGVGGGGGGGGATQAAANLSSRSLSISTAPLSFSSPRVIVSPRDRAKSPTLFSASATSRTFHISRMACRAVRSAAASLSSSSSAALNASSNVSSLSRCSWRWPAISASFRAFACSCNFCSRSSCSSRANLESRSASSICCRAERRSLGNPAFSLCLSCFSLLASKGMISSSIRPLSLELSFEASGPLPISSGERMACHSAELLATTSSKYSASGGGGGPSANASSSSCHCEDPRIALFVGLGGFGIGPKVETSLKSNSSSPNHKYLRLCASTPTASARIPSAVPSRCVRLAASHSGAVASQSARRSASRSRASSSS
mmetsp:Transcript_24079/g.60888  ORF Transcript_24079/g.60888 Transcript_24079/m.60888 type:complete len:410 (+) Transcript_24079:825-2054(+)